MVAQANFRPHARTMSEAFTVLKQQEQVNPVAARVVEDTTEWLEKGDEVRIERLVRRTGAPCEYGTLVDVNVTVQWGLVRFVNSTRREWFPIEELYLEQKAGASAPAKAATNAR